jgi:large subunit ribosomal protein L30
MSENIKIRWVRSGIAFSRKQKEIIRGLGLRRLRQVVERPDNAAVRGLIAKIPHLVEIVEGGQQQTLAPIPEYTIVRPEAAATARPEIEPVPAVESENSEQPAESNL